MTKKYFTLLIIFLFCSFGHAQSVVNIGISSDFKISDEKNEFINNALLDEIQKITGSTFDVQLDENNTLSSDWNVDQAKINYRTLSENCDVIILIGGVSLRGALEVDSFNIPTVALGVFDTSLQEVPYTKNGTSGVENFSYVLTSNDILSEIKGFKEIMDFENLSFLFDERTSRYLDFQERKMKMSDFEIANNISFSSLPINHETIRESLEAISGDIDAAYMGIPYEMNDEEIEIITDFFREKQIPLFAMNHRQVELGALACYSSDNNIDQVIRKIAIMVDDILNGGELKSVNVHINQKEDLYINMNVARDIDFSPSFQTLFTANIVGDPTIVASRTYSFDEILKISLEENLSINISELDISLSENDVAYAKSQFLPDADATVDGFIIDKNRPNPATGNAEQSISGSGSVNQLIYSETAIANIQIHEYILEAQKYATEQEILNQVLNVYYAYFNILQTKTNLLIQKENIAVTKNNLDLAKVKMMVGQESSSDVYRWESEVANSNQRIIEANADLFIAKFQLNALLNNVLDEEFDVDDISLTDDLFLQFTSSELGRNINNPTQLKTLSSFLVLESQEYYPSKKQLLSNLSAIDRQLVMNKRQYYTPSVAFSGQINQNFYRGGVGSEPLSGSEFYNTTWNAGIVITYPLFDGNRRHIDIQKSTIQQEQLNLQLESLDQNLELQVKTSVLQLLTSSTEIIYSKISADNTGDNFYLVQDNYQQGTVSITQLIDAQTAALNAKLVYSLSVYNYLVNFLNLENSIGHYSMLVSDDENRAFKDRFDGYKQGK